MKLIDFIVCEDIRDEQGNKNSLMGIFNDVIRINGSIEPQPDQDIPVPLLSIYFRCLVEEAEEKPTTIRIVAKSEEHAFLDQRVPVQLREGKIIVSRIRMPGFPLRLGKLQFEISYLDSTGKVLFITEPHPTSVIFEKRPTN